MHNNNAVAVTLKKVIFPQWTTPPPSQWTVQCPLKKVRFFSASLILSKTFILSTPFRFLGGVPPLGSSSGTLRVILPMRRNQGISIFRNTETLGRHTLEYFLNLERWKKTRLSSIYYINIYNQNANSFLSRFELKAKKMGVELILPIFSSYASSGLASSCTGQICKLKREIKRKTENFRFFFAHLF